MVDKNDVNRWMWSAALATLIVSLVRKIFK